MTYFQILTILINPIVFFLVVFFLRLRFQFNSPKIILFTILFSFIGAIAFVFIQNSLNTIIELKSTVLLRSLFYSFIVAGLILQLITYIVLRIVLTKTTHFIGPFEGILFATMVSLCFSTIILLSLSPENFNTIVGMLFGLSYPIMSVIQGVFLGYIYGVSNHKPNPIKGNILGIFLATIINGFYIFCLAKSAFLILGIFCIISIIISLLLVYNSINFTKPVSN